MPRILPQRQPDSPEHAVVPVPRPPFFKPVAGFILSSFVRGKIRRGDTNMVSSRRLLDEYLSIIPPDDQERILLYFNQMEKSKERLKNRRLPLLEHYKTAKFYEETSVQTLVIAKDVSDRAHHTELVSRMARETGLTDFSVDHPFHGLYRVHSTTSDWSDCTLPTATGEDPSSTDGRDTTMQHFLNLPPSVSSDSLSSNIGEEEDNSSRPGSSIGERPIEHLDMWSNAS